MRQLLFIISLWFLTNHISAQITFPNNGAPNPQHTIYAFTNCTLHVDADITFIKGVLIIQDSKIINAGENLTIPKNAVVVDLKGKHIYPAFIDLYSDYGITEPRKTEYGDASKKGAYGWNQSIKSELEAQKLFIHNQQRADEYRKQGFGAILTSSKDGIVRGSGAFVCLTNSKENESIIKDKAAAFYSLDKGSSSQSYPSSVMGAVALLRQTYYDAAWYKANETKTEYNISLDAFNKLQELPAIFEGNDQYNDILGKRIADEFNTTYIIKGGGNEYQNLYDIQNTGSKFIIPLNFPDALDVGDPYETEKIPLSELKHWELAPANLAMLEKNSIPFCITSSDLKNRSQFIKNLQKAVKHGLTEKTALKALTYNPASYIGMQDKIGSLKTGLLANFFIASKSIFEEDVIIYETWSSGLRYQYADYSIAEIAGRYKLALPNQSYTVTISKNGNQYSGSVMLKDSSKTQASIGFKNDIINLTFPYDSVFTLRLSGNYNEVLKSFKGSGQLSNGKWFDFSMNNISVEDTSKTKRTENKFAKNLELGKVYYPFCAYGKPLPENEGSIKEVWAKYKNRQESILIKNATVWTNESDSILKETDVYVVAGKIVKIAPHIELPKTETVRVIDAKGMHLTPGIIDEHSHIALFSVNEWADASSAEVRMSDAVNPTDINIYRQLSGGVTTSQLLHGSANPIGGQSCLIKLRWGKTASELKYEKADPFIKFALGENVKHSNGYSPDLVRFPQTRMGVEQLYYDYFIRAAEYKKQWEGFSKLSPSEKQKTKTVAPRKDLDLEAIAEILDNKRFITCHSYVQSEVNMLMHVADSMKFKVNTFTHILEGYKVADKMKAHGINASTFADWWAYKLEVMDAIPYNAAMLTKAGVNTSINSDDPEMGRRLNQEAAKTIKYGGLTEIEALKLVTLNPAKMLHIDDKVGSIKVGKVADMVLWSDNPLSIYAKVNTTMIDGQIYFDKTEDEKLREDIKSERARIISKLMIEKNKGAMVVKPTPKKPKHFHCDSE